MTRRVLVIAAVTLISGCGTPNGSNGSIQASATAAPVDVTVAADGVQLETGWYPLERFEGQTFRWVDNDAELLACTNPNAHMLRLQLEPGPGVGKKPFHLHVIGNHGDVQTFLIKARQDVIVPIAHGAQAETFRLHADSRNLPAKNDTRILNFRVFEASVGSHADDCSRDIVRDDSPIRLGANWGALETYSSDTFRWIDNDGTFTVLPAHSKPLLLEAYIAPGPSLGSTPLIVQLQNMSGKVIARTKQVRDASYQTFTLPAAPAGSSYRFHVQSPDMPVPNDKRTLNFRVLELHVRP